MKSIRKSEPGLTVRDGPAAWFRRGREHADIGNLRKAIFCWNMALRQDTKFAPAHLWLGMSYPKFGRLGRGMNHCVQAIILEYPGSEPYLHLSICHRLRNEYEEAHEILMLGIKAFPQDTLIPWKLSTYYEKMEKWNEALGYLKLCLEREPDNDDFWWEAGMIAFRSIDKKVLHRSAIEMRRLRPDGWESYYLLGLLEELKMDYGMAIRYLWRAFLVDGNPSVTDALNFCIDQEKVIWEPDAFTAYHEV